MSRTGVALAVALATLAVALAVTLSGSPLVVAQTNATPAAEPLLEARRPLSVCQAAERLPAGISAIRLTLVSDVGPRVSVSESVGRRLLADGTAPSGWTSGAVTIPVKPLSRPIAGARICFRTGSTAESVTLGGARASAATAAREADGRALPGRFTVEYMRRGHSSWWSLAHTVATHMGLGRAPAGGWIGVLVALLMGAVAAGTAWLAVRELP